MLDGVIETYKCLIGLCKGMPGIRLEDAFSPDAIVSLEQEYQWLLEEKKRREG